MLIWGVGGGVLGIFNSFASLFSGFFSARKVNLALTPQAQLRLQADVCSSNRNYSLSQNPFPQLSSVVSQNCMVRSEEVLGGGL